MTASPGAEFARSSGPVGKGVLPVGCLAPVALAEYWWRPARGVSAFGVAGPGVAEPKCGGTVSAAGERIGPVIGELVAELLYAAGRVVGDVAVFLWRFAAGRQLFGRPKTNATFFRRATRQTPTANPGRWSMAPGYVRAGVRLGVIAFVYGWWQYRTVTILTLGVALLTGVVLVWHRWRARRYERDVLAPIFDGLAPLLGLSGDEPVREWLSIPRNLDADDARVLVGLPRDFQGSEKQLKDVTALINRRLPSGPWQPHPRFRDFVIEYWPTPAAPSAVRYDEAPDRPLEVIPIGKPTSGADRWVEIELAALTPHVLMSAPTGWGKTSTALCLICHTAGRGALVDILDPKRIGYLDAFRGLPHIRIHTDIDNMIGATRDFLEEMERRYRLIEAGVARTEDFTPRILVEDEKGSLTVDIKAWWKRQGGKGDPLPMDWQRKILWQGRAARMYVFTFCQQANLNVLRDSDMRDQYGFKIAAGPQSLSSWRMLFGGPRGRIAKKKGRAFVAIGADDPEPIQLAWIDADEAREIAAAGAELALAGAAADRARASQDGDVPPVPEPRGPAETAGAVPGLGTAPASLEEGPAEVRPRLRVVPATEAAPAVAAAEPGRQDDDELLIGLQAAADFLFGDEDDDPQDRYERFRKARQRSPGRRIPGETRLAGQPAFPRLALLSWQSKRKIAGRRSDDDDSDRKAR